MACRQGKENHSGLHDSEDLCISERKRTAVAFISEQAQVSNGEGMKAFKDVKPSEGE